MKKLFISIYAVFFIAFLIFSMDSKTMNNLSAKNTSSIQIEKIAVDEDFIMESEFYIRDIDDSIFERIKGKSFKDNCTIDRRELRYLHVLHKNIEGQTLAGELICNRKIASILINIFKELYKASYPIEKIHLVDEYDADDEKSMRDNNSSCFNFRFISFTTTVSMHGLGLAVDINPLYNPYIKTVNGKINIEPATAKKYTDRQDNFPYKIDHNDLAYKLFTAAGFEWGGDWNGVKDYQHFEWVDKGE